MRSISDILNQNFINELFEEKKLIYFPELKNSDIKNIKVEMVSPGWAKETCLARYTIFFNDGGFKILRGAASKNNSKQNAWRIMDYLNSRGFRKGKWRVAKPLDFIKNSNLLLYEEARGIPLSIIIQEKDQKKTLEAINKAATWLFNLHELDAIDKSIPDAFFLGTGGYLKKFRTLQKLMPALGDILATAANFSFFNQMPTDKKTLIHNDFYPGNIIINKKYTCAIDFEKSGLGFRFFDLASMIGWFEFPDKIAQMNFSDKEINRFQKSFLEKYCELCGIDYQKTKKIVNIFIAKIFLDQICNYAEITEKGWPFLETTAKKVYEEKIVALINKAIKYRDLI